jgi:copper ion binding protein
MLSSTPRTFVGTTTVTVRGMTCGHCQRAIEQEVGSVEGIRDVAVDLAAGTVTVSVDRPVDRAEIAAAVDEAGYTLVP